MKFKSFLSLFGQRRRSKTTKAARRPTARRAPLFLEHLETRELLSNSGAGGAPRVIAVTPLDRSTTTNPQPIISVQYSEPMALRMSPADPNGVDNPNNYFLFNSGGNRITVTMVTYDAGSMTATLSYVVNGSANLPADDYTLFIEADRIFDASGAGNAGGVPLPVCQPGVILTANSGMQNIATIQMPGDGQLAAVTDYRNPNAIVSSPAAVAMADFNADGLADLAVLNRLASNVEIYFGLNGPDGGLSQVPNVTLTPPLAAFPTGLAAIDLNRDGVPEILTTNQGGTGSVTVFRNNGLGQFATGQTFNTSIGGANQLPVGVTAADLNGDGNADLAVANSIASPNGQNISILAGTNGGSFGAPVGFDCGLVSPTDIQVIQVEQAQDDFFNGFTAIQRPDLVVSGFNGVSVLTNQTRFPTTNFPTPGAFSFPVKQILAAVQATSVAVGDINGDGNPDIVAAESSNFANAQGRVDAYLNGGPPFYTFSPPLTANANPQAAIVTQGDAFGIQLGDTDGDGILDVIVANRNNIPFNLDDTLSVLKGDGFGGFTLVTQGGAPVLNIVDKGPVDAAVYIDPATQQVTFAATANNTAGDATVLRAKGDGTFFTSTQSPVQDADNMTVVASGDLNDDGLADLVMVMPTPGTSANPPSNVSNTLFVALATSQTTFGNPVPLLTGDFPVAVTLGRLTGPKDPVTGLSSGPLDILVVNQNENSVLIYGNNGAGQFPVGLRSTVSVGSFPTGIVLADFNNDGLLDLAVSHDKDPNVPPTLPNDRGVTVRLAHRDPMTLQGDRTFNPIQEVLPNIEAVSLVAADFNRDGGMDLAVLESPRATRVGSVFYLRGDGKGNFVNFGSFSANEDPSAIAVGDMDRDGFPDLVVANKGLTGFFLGGPSTVYVSVLINDRGLDFFDPIRKDVTTNSTARLTSLAIVNLNRDLFPDVIGAFGAPTGLGGTQVFNNVVGLLGSNNGTLGDPRLYAVEGGGRNVVPSVLAVGSDPFLRVTTFSTRGSSVSNNLIVNGNFEAVDLARESGNLVGWKSSDERDSHGYWTTQAGFVPPLSAASDVTNTAINVVNQPRGLHQAMLDQPNLNLPQNSFSGLAAFDGAGGIQPALVRKTQDYDGAHALYQDFTIPALASQVTISFLLYIKNTDPDASGVDLNLTGYSNPLLNGQPAPLNYYPNTPLRPDNQQVRVDLMDPNADVLAVSEGPDGAVLKRLFQTSQTGARIYDQGSNVPRIVPLPRVFTNGGQIIQITLTQAELIQLRGRTIRFRVAEANNQGKLIVGLDNVQVSAQYTDTQPPILNNLRMRNGGFGANPETFGGNTTDTTLIGKVSDDGTASNIDTIVFTAIDDTTGQQIGTFPFGRFDAVGNFEFKLPLTLPGPYTILVQGLDKAGNSFQTSFDFNFQGPSLAITQGPQGPVTGTWQAQGPGPIRFVSPLTRYTTVSGNITAIATDPRDSDGNTIYVGSDNGGVWKTTDGGHNWTPLTQFQSDPTLGPIPVPIGSIAIDPSNPDNVFAVTGIADNQPTTHPGFGLLKSTDAGKSFVLVAADTFKNAKVSKLVIARRTLDGVSRMYAAVASGGKFGQGVYMSVDDGLTWTDVLDPAKMFLENGTTTLGSGAALPSVTDLVIDPNSFDQQNIWIGLGNIGLVADSPNTSVWLTTNFGATWQRKAGGQMQTNQAFVPNQTIPTGVGVRRVTLAIATGRPGDEAYVYALINNPTAATESPLSSGLFKTKHSGTGWTHVMLRQVKPTPGRVHNYVDLDLFGNLQSEQDASDTLLVDPSNPNVVYLGGSTRFFFNPQGIVQQNPHGLLRIDTSNMRDTDYRTPVSRYPTPGAIPNFAPVTHTFDIPNDGDDVFKAIDAAFNTTTFTEPGIYINGEDYRGEGVFFMDLAENVPGFFQYNQLRLPATVHSMAFDGNARLLVGTLGGIWRNNTTGYIYDITSGGDFSLAFYGTGGIETEDGVATPTEPNVLFTDLNGNLQISDQLSIAIDPVNLNTYNASVANLGYAQSSGGLPNSLQWITTNNQIIGRPPGNSLFDPFVQINPFVGIVRAGPLPDQLPATGRPFSTVYRTLANRQLATGAGLTFDPDLQIEKSIQNGDIGTYFDIVSGLADLSTNFPAFYPPLAVNSTQIVDDRGVPLDELLFGTTNELFKSTNGGDQWFQVPGDFGGGIITALAIAKSGKHAYYVGTNQGKVFVDLRNGSTPFPNQSTGLPNLPINGIAVDPTNENVAYAAIDGFGTGQGRLFKTTDGGKTWVDITGMGAAIAQPGKPGRLPDLPTYAVAIDVRSLPGSPNGKIFVGTETGVFVSLDGGLSWNTLSKGIPNVPARDISFNVSTETVAVATMGAGTFTISTDQIGPRIVSIVPSTPTVPFDTSTPPVPFQTVQVVFSEPVDPRTFTPQIISSFTGPNGPIAVLSVTPAPNPLNATIDNTYFTITFLPQTTDGIYSLTVQPMVKDFVGNLMDQNGNMLAGEVPNDLFTGRYVINTNDNGRFVTGGFHDLLNRVADTEGFISFIGAIETARQQSLVPVAISRIASDEARGNLVAGFYSLASPQGSVSPLGNIGDFLGRTASPAEIANWVAALKNGALPQDVIAAIVASPEYFAKNGNTDAGFLNQLYPDLLGPGRVPDAQGLANWTNALAQKEAAARVSIANIFLTSQEYRERLVRGYYLRLLGRSASNGEVSLFIGALQQGATDEQVQANIMGSAEYFANHGSTNASWLDAAFKDILNRNVDQQGLAAFLPQLNAGVSREVIARQIFASDEYFRILVNTTFQKFLGIGANATELNTFAAQLKAGLKQEAFIAMVVASDKYYALKQGSATTQPAQDNNWVKALYNDLLGRGASAGEVSGFTNALAQLEAENRRQVALAFMAGGEFLARVVQTVYVKYLTPPGSPNRTASAAEVNRWVPLLQQGSAGPGKPSPIETFIAAVVSSNEFLANQKDPAVPNQNYQTYSNVSWVNGLYQSVLGRPPETAGFNDALMSVLGGYFAQRLSFAQALTVSDEYRTDLVTGYFTTFLRRKGTAAEIAAQVARLKNGATDEQIVATLLSGNEYFQNPTLGNNSNSTWLNKVYRDLLGRDRDAGSNPFLTGLSNGTLTRLQVVTQILDFDEYFNRRIGQIYVALLARNAATAELDFWRLRIRREGLTLEQVMANIMASPEYFLRTHPYP